MSHTSYKPVMHQCVIHFYQGQAWLKLELLVRARSSYQKHPFDLVPIQAEYPSGWVLRGVLHSMHT